MGTKPIAVLYCIFIMILDILQRNSWSWLGKDRESVIHILINQHASSLRTYYKENVAKFYYSAIIGKRKVYKKSVSTPQRSFEEDEEGFQW